MSDGRGLPLLSGPPPEYTANEPACRKCNKEFNILFARSRKCNHCGYTYCHSCTDFQALMPRRGSESGYDPVPVCGFCIELLQVTASGKGQLKQVPMARLKKYAKAYNIDVAGVLEKDEFVERLVAARAPYGCLPSANESFYRKHSVPNRSRNRPRGIFTRAMDAMAGSSSNIPPPPQPQYAQRPPYQPRQRTTSGPSRFPRPDLDPHAQQQQYRQQYHQQQTPPQPRYYHQQHYAPPPGPPPRPNTQPARPSNTQPPRPNNNLNTPPTSRPRSASATHTPRARSPAQPVEVPSVDELLAMSDDTLAHLSIGVLKEILFKNHVNPGLVLEKGDLVARVKTLVEEERLERERRAREEEEERAYEEEMRRAREEEEAAHANQSGPATSAESPSGGEGGGQPAGSAPIPIPQAEGAVPAASSPSTSPMNSASPPAGSTMTPKAQAMASRLERTGLCVICQDEEANIAIVDCGHLALCRGCSDLIMKSTRECPLCRTRIVTESRLLRIFKT
ncbi:hypothetical protein C8Q79DRAFT_983074 [Trametes meyenii]|nr:hypothetical protein C8Q79DRAFT_983074 [Trametes meyenii]